MFHLFTSTRVIVQDEYHDVLICYKCFQLDDHVANACPKGNENLVCSDSLLPRNGSKDMP